MTPLLIISSIILYLIVGGIALGIAERVDNKKYDGDVGDRVIAIVIWPLVAIVGLVLFCAEVIPRWIRGGKR